MIKDRKIRLRMTAPILHRFEFRVELLSFNTPMDPIVVESSNVKDAWGMAGLRIQEVAFVVRSLTLFSIDGKAL